MQVFFSAVIAFFIGILQWITKKFGVSKVVLAVQIAVGTMYVAFILATVAFFLNFLFKLWNTFKQLVDDLNHFGVSVSGVSYGISNSQIVNSFWGLIHESGLDDAVMTSFALFVSMASLFFAIQTYKIVRFAYKELYTILVDLIKTTLI